MSATSAYTGNRVNCSSRSTSHDAVERIGKMVRIGIVGIGFMGMIHYLAARKLKGARVTAICSRDPKKLAGDWRGIRGNFGPTGQKMDLSDLKKYNRLEDL